MGMWENKDPESHWCCGDSGVECLGFKRTGLTLSFPGFFYNESEDDHYPDVSIDIKFCPFCGFSYTDQSK